MSNGLEDAVIIEDGKTVIVPPKINQRQLYQQLVKQIEEETDRQIFEILEQINK